MSIRFGTGAWRWCGFNGWDGESRSFGRVFGFGTYLIWVCAMFGFDVALCMDWVWLVKENGLMISWLFVASDGTGLCQICDNCCDFICCEWRVWKLLGFWMIVWKLGFDCVVALWCWKGFWCLFLRCVIFAGLEIGSPFVCRFCPFLIKLRFWFWT